MKKVSVRIGSVLMVLLVLFSTIPLGTVTAKAILIDNNAVFIKQATSYTCTLASATMMLRRRAIIDKNSDWEDITESAVRGTGWLEGTGLYFSFKYSGMSVGHNTFSSDSTTKKNKMISLLSSHPEGIVIYNTSQPHAVLLTDYNSTTDTFYCADPAGSAARVTLLASTLNGSSQANVINGVSAYWYLTNKSGWGNYYKKSLNFYGNYSGSNYLLGSDFSSSLNSNYIFSRDTSVYTLSIDTANAYLGSNSLKIVGKSAGSSGKDMAFTTDTNGNTENNFFIGDNKTMTLSFYAKSSVSGAKMYWRWGYVSTYYSCTLTTSWAKYTISVPKNVSCGTTLHPYIDKASTVYLNQIMLNDGSAATTFQPETSSLLSSITATYGNTYGALPSPTRTGYVFNGWYTAKTGGSQILSATAVKTDNLNVYAHWDPIAITGITVKTNPTKVTYYAGETLNQAGLTLTATYNNGTTSTISSGFVCTPTTLSTTGTQPITVTYEGKTATFNVTVSNERLVFVPGHMMYVDIDRCLLSNINVGTSAGYIKTQVINKNIQVIDKNGVALLDSEFVTTGCKLQLLNNDIVIDELTLVILGDLNGDGSINTIDVLVILQVSAGTTNINDLHSFAGDVNRDGKISSLDALKLLQFTSGLIESL